MAVFSRKAWRTQRYRIFSPEKFTRQSHSIWEHYFSFSWQSLQATHSKKIWYLQKKVKKKVLYAVFRNFSNFGGVFFFHLFPKNFVYFFFPRKSLKSTHSLKFKEPLKKNTAPEKKTKFSLTHSILPKIVKSWTFTGK